MPVLASRFHATKEYRRMAGNYVYYNRLLQEENPFFHFLYASAMGSFQAQLTSLQGAVSATSKAISNLKQMANAELMKEEDFLRRMFGKDINVNLMNLNSVKDLIDTLNGALQFKEIYERNRALILETKGQKNITTWFGGYFNKAWNENISSFSAQLASDITGRSGEPLRLIVENQVDAYIEICIRRAIQIMTTEAEKENGLDNDEYSRAYREFYSGLLQFESNMRSLSSSLREVFQLDELKQYVMEQIDPGKRLGDLRDAQKSLAAHKNIHSQGGESLEVWENAIVMQALTGALSGPGYWVTGTHTGQYGVKADNIYTAKIDIDIEGVLAETSSNSREQNIEAFSRLGAQLAQMNDGFIIYSNAKNYTLNSDFHGFSAGADMNLNKLGSILELAGQTNTASIIGVAEQLGAGAIGDKTNGKQVVERYIALNVAAFLFDDFTTIGEANMTGANALHIFDLNGVFIPFSVVLFKLAEAAERSETEVNSIVKVTLSVPPILYPESHTGIGRWNEQRQHTLANTKISIHFLKGIRELLAGTL